MKNYFSDIVKHDPVNHLLLLQQKDLIQLKHNISLTDINQMVSQLAYLFDEPIYHVLQKDQTIFPDFDPHDYVSLATYYHPNPKTEDGLPYVRYDGIPNDENDKLDKKGLRYTGYILYHHLLLYYLTDDKRYYLSVKERLNTYFIDPKTAMNPHMNHGQMIKGINLGRGIGIIDFASTFTYVIQLFKVLYDMKYIEESLYQDYKKWLSAFLHWLRYSDIALQERDAKNNHGSMYDLLLMVIYDTFDMYDEIKSLTYAFIDQRLLVQFDANGALPRELARTKSKSYALMGYKALADFARMSEQHKYSILSINSWYYKNIDDYMHKGMTYLIDRLVINRKDWRYKQIQIFDKATLLPLIWFAKTYNIDAIDLFNIMNKKDIENDILYIIVKNLII